MSAATSPGTGLAYGLRRVCAAWGMARSSFYAMTSGQHAEQPPAKRRGPKPAISDQALLVAIEADLEASPWEGEGYRKVWARLRVCRDIRVARKRVLRLMRENNLLSPHRCRRRGGNPHDGEIITHAPNLMWGTDGVRVFTVDDGWGWIFTAVEHWNAECVGWHVCKRGDRFAALQPISMGLAGLYGSTAAGAARGLALRMDHGSQYLSDHFTNQIKFWGIQPSYAFVAEPQTNGVAERFNRTLKEQIIHGRIYRNIAELRDAVRDFVELYNAQWIVQREPDVVAAWVGEVPFLRETAQAGDTVELVMDVALRSRCASREDQIPLLDHHKEQQPVDEAQELLVVVTGQEIAAGGGA